MRISFFLFVAILMSITSASQSSFILETTFYDLPIKSSRGKIRERIISDNRFSEKNDSDTSRVSLFKNTFYGDINKHALPGSFDIDSATIELTWGYGMFTKASTQGRELTIIRLKYFISDISTSNSLAIAIWSKHRGISPDTSELTVGREEDKNFAFGKQIKLSHKSYLPQLSVLQQKISDKIFVVIVEFERYGD